MKQIIFLLIFTFSFGYYQVGDTLSLEDQQFPLSVCYGEYENDTLRIIDFNGDYNGGDYSLIVFRITATW